MSETASARAEAPRGRYLAGLSLAALGIIFGDIGTSPLYALRERFHASHGVEPNQANVLGVLSLVFWSLILVVSIKYLVLVVRVDKRVRGGVLALVALAVPPESGSGGSAKFLALLWLFGAALTAGGGIMTPAISVVSAVEGVGVAAPRLSGLVIPVSVAILVAFFAVQSRGTGRMGAEFGADRVFSAYAVPSATRTL